MTKDDVIETVAFRGKLEKKSTKKAVELFIEVIKENIKEGKTIYIRGFGTLSPKTRKASTGRDIGKNKIVEIPARTVPHFKPSNEFKQQVISANASKDQDLY